MSALATSAKSQIRPTMTRMARTNAMGPYSGRKTNHHDHEMTLQSFKTMNAMHRRPKKPMPPDAEDEVLLMRCLERGEKCVRRGRRNALYHEFQTRVEPRDGVDNFGSNVPLLGL